MSFASMKKNDMSFEELSNKLEDAGGSKGKSYNDDRQWYPKLDEQKNGYAVIRFLPASENDDLPFVKLYSHGFKGETGQWYFENCPTTLDNDCPVCSANRALIVRLLNLMVVGILHLSQLKMVLSATVSVSYLTTVISML